MRLYYLEGCSSIPYSAASDSSGIARVELWAREALAPWAFSGLYQGTASGSFTFVPAGTGIYNFDLVAEDTVGNRSAAPAGAGQGTTTFTAAVGDWSLFDR